MIKINAKLALIQYSILLSHFTMCKNQKCKDKTCQIQIMKEIDFGTYETEKEFGVKNFSYFTSILASK